MLVGSRHWEGGAGRASAKATGMAIAKQHGKDAGDGRGWDLESTQEALLIRSSSLPSLELRRDARHWI